MIRLVVCMPDKNPKYSKLTKEEEEVILNKGTERPFTGKYNIFKEKGSYVCKLCRTPLYHSKSKFDSGCGWPSFSSEIQGKVKRSMDKDGIRTEITCMNCGAHLVHAAWGERYAHNQRHCVNSISIDFIPDKHDKSIP